MCEIFMYNISVTDEFVCWFNVFVPGPIIFVAIAGVLFLMGLYFIVRIWLPEPGFGIRGLLYAVLCFIGTILFVVSSPFAVIIFFGFIVLGCVSACCIGAIKGLLHEEEEAKPVVEESSPSRRYDNFFMEK